LGNFVKFLYLDKKDRILAMLRRLQGAALTIGVLLLLFLPLCHDHTSGRFFLEPAERAVVRARVAGEISEVFVGEGMEVKVGAPLLQMRNMALQSKVSESEAELSIASMMVSEATLHNANLGLALVDRDRLKRQARELENRASLLEVTSPIQGVLLTPKLADRVGAFVPEGMELAEIANLEVMRARIYVSDHDMSRIRAGALATAQVTGVAKKWNARTLDISPVSSEIAPELAEKSKYTGLNPLNFYVVDLAIANPNGILKPGMVGIARIYGQRRSLAGLIVQQLIEFFGRKAW